MRLPRRAVTRPRTAWAWRDLRSYPPQRRTPILRCGPCPRSRPLPRYRRGGYAGSLPDLSGESRRTPRLMITRPPTTHSTYRLLSVFKPGRGISRPEGGALRSDGAATAGPVRCAQVAFAQLAGGIAGHLGDEADAAGPLHPGQPAVQRGEQFGGELRAGPLALGGLNDRLDLLAPVLIRHPEHRHVSDLGVRQQLGLDLGGVDVGAAGDDHVGLAVAEEQEPGLVPVADVADGEVAAQPVRRGLGRVALVDEVADPHLHVHRAGHSGRAVPALVVGDQDLADRPRRAHRARVREPVPRRGDRAAA